MKNKLHSPLKPEPQASTELYPRYSPEMNLTPGQKLICLILEETFSIDRIEGTGQERIVVATCTEGPHKGGQYRLRAPLQYTPSVRSDLWRGWRVRC